MRGLDSQPPNSRNYGREALTQIPDGMMETSMIFDGHAYCFPDVRGDLGFPSADAQRIHVQKAIASHHVQPWRASDHALGSTAPLLDLDRWPEDDSAREFNFRPTTNGS